MSRRINVPFVRTENGVPESASARMIPRHQPVPALGALVGIRVRPERDGLVPPGSVTQLLLERLDHVHLDDDLRVEVPSGVEVEVGVRAPPGEAIVADHTVGDEVTGSSGDIDQVVLAFQRLDGDHSEVRNGLDSPSGDIADIRGIESGSAEAHQPVVRREMRALARLSIGDVLPSTTCQESVIAAGDELGAVGQSHPEGLFPCRPFRLDPCAHVPPKRAIDPRAIDLVTDPKVADGPLPAVSAQDQRVGGETQYTHAWLQPR